MHPEIASALADERQRDLARRASKQRQAHEVSEYSDDTSNSHPSGHRIPRYRVSWSRMSLPAIGAAGRRERSWVIVISATRGL
jgi:hypothetical protein